MGYLPENRDKLNSLLKKEKKSKKVRRSIYVYENTAYIYEPYRLLHSY